MNVFDGGFFDELLDNITTRISGFFSGFVSSFSDYAFLVEFYAIGIALALGTLTLTWLFGGLPVLGKWIRASGGVAVLGYGLFLAGMQVMFNHRKTKR